MLATAEKTVATSRPLSDLQMLQGVWKSTAGPKAARLLIAGHRYTFEFLNGDVYMGTYVLDSEAEPKRIDMYVEEGPEEYVFRIAHCIFETDGAELRWCPSRPGSPERLHDFPSVDDPSHLSLHFQHVRPKEYHV